MQSASQSRFSLYAAYYRWLLLASITLAGIGVEFNNTALLEWLNGYHVRFLDDFFQVFGLFGNIFFAFVLFSIFFRVLQQEAMAVQTLVTCVISGLTPRFFQFMARIPYADADQLHKLEVGRHVRWTVFPNGHATIAFALATLFSVHFCTKSVSVLLFLVAILVGCSQLYLGQDSLPAVLCGACLGCYIALFAKTMFLG